MPFDVALGGAPPWIAAADRDDLVGVDALVRLLADQLLDLRLRRRHAGHPADEHDMVDLRRVEPGVRQGLLGRADRPLEQVMRQLLELGARQLQVEVLRALGRGGDERPVDLGRHRRGELDLRRLAGLVDALERHRVDGQVDPLVALELRDHPVDDRLVEVVAAEVVVAVRRLDLEDPAARAVVAELEHRHVERAAAEVEDEDHLVRALLVEPVGERCRGRLVDDADDVQAGDLPGVLRRLALGVVEVRGDGDHRVGDRLAEVGLGVGLQLLEDHRGELRRRVLLAACLHAHVVVRARDDLVRDDLHLLRDLVMHYLRPMKRLIEKIVFCGFVTCCRRAGEPTSR